MEEGVVGRVRPQIRSVDRMLGPELERALATLTAAPEDAAAVALARQLAAAIDADERQGVALAELSSKLLAVLVQLGLTPAARARVARGGASGGPSRLDILRARRQA